MKKYFALSKQIIFIDLMILLFCNLLQFYKQYFYQDCTFPYDFSLSYYYITYVWLKMFNWSNVPVWNPYASFGYPEHLSIQSGAFYPPFLFLKLFNVEYTFYVATIVQCLHAFWGMVGVYALGKYYKLSRINCLFAAVAYGYSSGFFSNGQHADIIRSYGFIPWLYLIIQPSFLLSSVWKSTVFLLISFCFLTTSYPGIIIYSAYLVAPVCLVKAFELKDKEKLIRYFTTLLLLGISAILMVMPKYLPSLLLSNELGFSGEGEAKYGRALIENLYTLIFPYESGKMSEDTSMRTLFMAPIYLILALGSIFYFLKNLIKKQTVAINQFSIEISLLFLFVFSTILLFKNPLSDLIFYNLPGFKANRFALVGIRPFWHFSIIMLGSIFLNHIINWSWNLKLPFLFLPFIIYLILFISGINSEMFALIDIKYSFKVVLLLLLSVLLILNTKKNEYWAASALILSLYLSFSYSYFQYHEPTWSVCNFREKLIKENKFDYYKFFDRNDEWRRIWYSRPERVTANSTILGRGNIDMISQKFTTNGYNSGVKILKILNLWGNNGLFGPTKFDTPIARFLISPSQSITVKEGLNLEECFTTDKCNADKSFKIGRFYENGAAYSVDLASDTMVVENEIFYNGWKGNIENKNKIIEAISVNGLLRGWKLPAGKYKFITYYDPPGWVLSKWLFLLGLLLYIFHLLILKLRIVNNPL